MSLFSNSDARHAQMFNAGTATTYQQQIDELLKQAQGAGANALTGGRADQLLALQQGYGAAQPFLTQARAAYDPYAQGGANAFQTYQGALGLNGQGGYDAAVGAFHASPGYQYRQTQGADQTARAAAASGQLLSGNAIAAIQDRASNLADQEYGSWLGNVRGVADTGYQAAGAQAGIDLGQGKMAYGYGGDQSSVYGDTAARLASLYGNTATQRAGSLNSLSQSLIDANNSAFKSSQDADVNRINLLGGIAGLASKIAAAPMTGGGSLGGNLLSKWIG
jgi:hypothetical protein